MYKVEINKVLFLDIEPLNSDYSAKKIREVGLIIDDFHKSSSSSSELVEQIMPYNPTMLCGHNLRKFDYEYLKETAFNPYLKQLLIIDTLELSLLFFSEKTLHKLPKPYRDNDPNSLSDPLEDSKLTKKLLLKIIKYFFQLSPELQSIYVSLLASTEQFKPFFDLILDEPLIIENKNDLLKIIKQELGNAVQSTENLEQLIINHPIELAHIVSVLHGNIAQIKSFPPKIYFDYSHIQEKLNSITFNLHHELDHLEQSALKYFGFDSFRSFPKFKSETDLFSTNNEVSQKEIVEACLKEKNLLTVLPTGGGKTFTFWLPAIIKAKRTRALTVVISPLQALMKDHIFNFNTKLSGISSAEALSGYLTLPEKRNIIRRIINGSIDILYLAPESLRSKNIERLLSYRYIERIVIDEAHCLSTWGNDFRHDYFYIAQFIQKIQDKKYNQQHIPISCFTATANTNVINEVEQYFKEDCSK